MFYLNGLFVTSLLFICESYQKFDYFFSLFRDPMLAFLTVSTKFLFTITKISPIFIIFFLLNSLDVFCSFSNISKLRSISFLFWSFFFLSNIYILLNSLALSHKFCCVEFHYYKVLHNISIIIFSLSYEPLRILFLKFSDMEIELILCLMLISNLISSM